MEFEQFELSLNASYLRLYHN